MILTITDNIEHPQTTAHPAHARAIQRDLDRSRRKRAPWRRLTPWRTAANVAARARRRATAAERNQQKKTGEDDDSVDALASLRRPIHVREIEDQRELVEYERGPNTEQDRAEPRRALHEVDDSGCEEDDEPQDDVMDMERSHGEAPAAGFLEEGVRDDPRRNERQEERDGAEQSGLLADIADLLAVDAGDSGSERAHRFEE